MSLLLSSPLPVTRLFSSSTVRVSDHPSTSYSSSSSPSLSLSYSSPTRFSHRRRFCALHSASRMADCVQIVASSSGEEEKKPITHSRTFLEARTQEELLSGIRKESDAGKVPPNVASAMEELYRNYKQAIVQSGAPEADDIVLSNVTALFDRVLLDLEDPFIFPPYHKAVREPFDYYMFGQNYIRPLIDFGNSYVGNMNIFQEMEKKVLQGDNIILISNHQSEADPAVIALLLEQTSPHIAENMTYVAGDRVLTDALCKPFSMGRNLLSVYSKKHMFDDPKLVEMKKKANIRSLKEMAVLLRTGSQVVWIAPSGGRDRPDPITEEWNPAPFESSSVDNIRRLAEHAGVPVHIYPLALLCYSIMPPPPKVCFSNSGSIRVLVVNSYYICFFLCNTNLHRVEREIGERRVFDFHGAGLSVQPAPATSEFAASSKNPEEVKEAYTKALYASVTEQYNVLKAAIHGKKRLEASNPNISLSKPWE